MKGRNHLDSDRLRIAAVQRVKEKEYWLDKLSGEPVKSSFPCIYKEEDAGEKISSQDAVNVSFNEKLSSGLMKLSTGSDIRLHIILVSILTLLLAKYTNNDDIIVGAPILKSDPDTGEELINTVLIIRNQLFPGMTFKELLLQVRQTMIEADEHRNYPIELLVHQLDLPFQGENNDFPLLDVALMVENIHDKQYLSPVTPKIIFSFSRTNSIIKGHVQYKPSFYCQGTIEGIIRHFQHLVEMVLANVEVKVSDLDLLSPGEKNQLLLEFNDPGLEYPQDKTLHQLFREQVQRTPGNTALVGKEQGGKARRVEGKKENISITYKELNHGSDLLAYLLQEKGVKPGAIVAIMAERSIEMIVGILGILKAGAAYLPVNPRSPAERIRYMLADSSTNVLVTTSMLAEEDVKTGKLKDRDNIEIVLLDSFTLPSSHLHLSPAPATCLAYVIYTSGSTGNPKGVPISHSNFSPLVHWGYTLGISSKDRVIQNLSYYFDWSVWEIFITITTGAALYMIPGEILLNPQAEVNFILENAVTVLHITPTQYQYFINVGKKPETLKYLFIGAEKLTVDLLKRSFASVNDDCRVFNMYGPTEATIISAVLEIHPSTVDEYQGLSSVPIGRTVANNLLLILDPHMKLSPIGVTGELYIAGDALAQGYLNNPELTAEKFIIATKTQRHKDVYFSWCLGDLVAKLYTTGDRARWLPDGIVEFLGRVDYQVKIRGFRIEPGEIENRLLNHPEIKEALVMARQYGNGENYLCAYIVPSTFDTPGAAAASGSLSSLVPGLRDRLSSELPGYMVPAHFIVLEKMPLNPNGKVDIKALPEPGPVENRAIYAAPRDELEKKLAGIWKEILDLPEEPGIDDHFFDLGGHSLNATTVVHHVYREFEVNIEIQDVFVHPTIRELAQPIKEMDPVGYATIAPVEEKEYYPLSYAQRRLWVLCQFEEDSTAYNMPVGFIITGTFNIQVFTRAVQALANRHESFRTVFIPVEGEPYQKVTRNFTFHPEPLHLLDLEKEAKEQKARGIYLEIANRAFDLEHGPLFLFKPVRLEEEKYLLIYNMHHIVNDGWSQGVIINELITLYNVFCQGKDNPLAPLEIQYKDYTRWHHCLIETDDFRKSGQYWLKKLHDKPNGIELPIDHPRKAIQTFNGGRVTFTINRETTAMLQKLSLREDATLFMSLLTLLSIFLYRISSQTDVIIGAPIANRKRRELHPIVGFLVNTLVYRNEVNPGCTFKEQLRAIKEEALACYQYQDFPFDLVVEQLELDRDLSQSPLFNVMLAHNNTETQDQHLALPGISISGYAHSEEFNMSKFDLIFFMDEMNDEVYTCIEYNSDLFDRSTIERMAKNFLALARDVIARSDVSISSLNILSKSEYETVIHRFNDTGYPFEPITLQELFERQVEQSGDKTALVGPVKTGIEDTVLITYKELNKKANQLAHYLGEECQVKPNDIIGVSVDRSIYMIITLLGIIKAGGAYLAVDPTYPRDRVLHVLADSQSRRLIIDKMRPEFFEGYPGEIVNITDLWDKISEKAAENPVVVNQPPDILYVNYTSGSTGTPNGAMLSHDLLRNLIQWQNEKTSIDCSLSCLQFTSINFCVSFQEIIGTLTAGGKLCLINDVERQDIDYLMDFLSRNQIEILFLPFSYLNFLFNESSRWNRSFEHNLKHIITAGEQLKITSGLKRFLDSNPHLKLHNHYGSTEMHVVTSYTLDASTASRTPIPPAGKPISNTKIYILDEHLNPVPGGVWGELLVSGISEVLGYIDNDRLTNSKLVNHPVFPVSVNRHRLYRSGDIGRWLENGNIELRGRKDFMVKVRGFRVEPGEIESKILSIDSVRECVVVVREDQARQKCLVAYLVKDNSDKDVNEIKRIITGDLPQYMIPQLVVLERLPLMPNGKVDRDQLPETELNARDEYIAPGNRVEEKLVEIWSRVLGIEAHLISIDANFFELGGHSLKATLLAAAIHKQLEKKVPLVEIFKAPTIMELSGYIAGMKTHEFSPVKPVENKEYYTLSSAQQRLYILQRMVANSTGYNLPAVVLLEGNLHRERFQWTFKQLISRHESFRTSFQLVEGKPVQRIHDKVEFEIEGLAAPTYNGKLPTANCQLPIISDFIRPFDLSQAPLLRVGLIPMEENQHILMIDMHHIISDGTSLGILTREFMALYADANEPLPRLKLQYKDYSEWQNSQKEKKSLLEQEAFWLKQFAGEIPILELPTDFPRPVVQSFEGKTKVFSLDKEETTALKRIAFEQNATLYMVLLTIYSIFLSKISSQEDIVTGTPVAGRRHADLANIIGIFINTLGIRNFLGGEETFDALLDNVKERTLEAFENQDYQFEKLVEKVAVPRDTGRNPLFDVMFALQNMEIIEIEIPGLKLEPYPYENNTSKFDLGLYAIEIEEELLFNMEYSTALFKEKTIERFTRYFKKIVSHVLKDSKKRIFQIEVISAEEKQQLLFDFNNTAAGYPKDMTIYKLFEQQVEKSPDNIALVEEGTGGLAPLSITYRQLNKKSNQLAYFLQERGIQHDTIVAIKVERSIEMVIGILGIMKAGGAYLPIDPDYPEERVVFMLADSSAKILLTDRDINLSPKALSTLSEGRPFNSHHSSFIIHHSCYLAYVIYTSGSTGTPKGVMVDHTSIVNTLSALDRMYPFTSSDVYLLKTSYLFDVSMTELFGWFWRDEGIGGHLALLAPGSEKEPLKILAAIEKMGITHINFVPSMFNVFVDQLTPGNAAKLSGLKYIFIAGEALSPGLVNRFHQEIGTHLPHVALENLYGPTESAVYASKYPLSEWNGTNDIPIGKPIQNIRLYVLNKELHLQPIGVTGELYISGVGLARGYLNRPELTAEKFDHDLWDLQDYHDGYYRSYKSYMSYIYRTGDLARWLPDGNIEFLGRIDHQVKIRGYRIELGEIQSLLLEHDKIKEAVVLTGEHENDDKYLCAYIVGQQEVAVPELREYLSKSLPGYMIPSYFVTIEKIPLTTNGKVDRKALPAPMVKSGEDYIAPGDEVEKILVEIWSEVLGRDIVPVSQIGINDNFFLLGGNSLKATFMLAKVLNKFDIDISLGEIFKTPTISRISSLIKAAQWAANQDIDTNREIEEMIL